MDKIRKLIHITQLMYDRIKIWQPNIGDLEQRLKEKFKFEKTCLDPPFGCFDYPRTYHDLHDGVDIVIHRKYVEHELCFKYFFPQKKNSNLTFLEIQAVRDILVNKYFVDPINSQIINLEVGFSLFKVPATTTLENTITFRSKLKSSDTYQGRGDGIKFRCAQYDIKMYDRAKRLKLKNQNMLGLEIKYLKSESLSKRFASNLDDLLKIDAIQALFQSYTHVINNLIIIDPAVIYGLPIKDVLYIKDCQNGINWKTGYMFGDAESRQNARRKIATLHRQNNVPLINEELLYEATAKYKNFMM